MSASIFSIVSAVPRDEYERILPLTINGRATVTGAVLSTPFQAVQSKMQPGWFAVILGYGVTVRDTAPVYDWGGSLKFQLLIDGAPFLDNNSGVWTGQRGSCENPLPTFIQCPNGASITFNVFRAIAYATTSVVDFVAYGYMSARGNSGNADAGQYRV